MSAAAPAKGPGDAGSVPEWSAVGFLSKNDFVLIGLRSAMYNKWVSRYDHSKHPNCSTLNNNYDYEIFGTTS